ncbi:UTP--GlnB (protein PII) uridylyltransferase, GlnD [Oceanicella actignis]|uniref:Bifunctional uridylyltransferase/uridylyl-removing enzyme n=1 Tax=Oceanicella actignis TaxID=1189325 RepID=A0A1M7TB83_9RHOB|nr:UTP--GlnB (protein PII) uridylyltransferase, GlnD [Oceanicella actignis]SHN67953.1 UTP--GlnB (protein PII) uridylyltransferase, GlnD [Oceanicella actignis]
MGSRSSTPPPPPRLALPASEPHLDEEGRSPVAAPGAEPAERPAESGGELLLPVERIIDRDDALARLAAAAEAAEGRADVLRAEATAILREKLERGHEAIRAAFEARPMAGAPASRAVARLTDEIVRLAVEVSLRWLHPLHNPTTGERLTVAAVGGYGRFEMAPHSDVDLLFLTPWKKTAWVENVVESTLYILWDLRLKVGHAVRSIDDCLRLAAEDVTIRTALLEKRFICGDMELHAELDQRLWSELFERTGPQFVEAKLEERARRHERHGGSRYLLEPNVKESKGGLRDLQTLYWIAKYLYHAATPQALVEKGVFDEDERRVFSEAADFLWTVRFHLHYAAGRANDQLTFDQQVEVARRMGFDDAEGQRGVERFMQAYFRHARNVGELTRIFLAALEARHVKRRPGLGALVRAFHFGLRRGEGPFRLRDGRLDLADPDAFEKDPLNMLRLLDEGMRTGALIHPAALRKMAASVHLVDDAMRADPVANQMFLNLLLGHGNPERALRRMNETGLLGAFIPEFARIVAMMQFNMYHHYTVDEHTILAISILSQIERGERKDALPIASRILAEGVNRTVLYVALLLHDIGKGQPRDHSEVGAEIAARLCPRLGLNEADSATVEWLVRHHLLMSDVAQKRDISDPATVRAFADVVRSPERLKLLLVLTACDIMAVGPGVWNNWKAQLLRQLYRDTREALTGGHDRQTKAERVDEAKAALRELLTDWTAEEIEAEINRHYAAYWLGLRPEIQAVFARLARIARDDAVASDITADPSRDATRACFYMADHPGIFSRMAGAIALAGANVVDARTFTTADGYACSVFWIQDPGGRPYDAARLDRLRRAIDRTLAGEVVAREALKPKRKLKKRVSEFRVPTRVVFDNESSDLYTVIEVDTQDRIGLLHDLTRALTASNVSIVSAIIATYGAQAVDVFYVKDLFGLKIRNPAKMRAIEERLRAAIDAAASQDERPAGASAAPGEGAGAGAAPAKPARRPARRKAARGAAKDEATGAATGATSGAAPAAKGARKTARRASARAASPVAEAGTETRAPAAPPPTPEEDAAPRTRARRAPRRGAAAEGASGETGAAAPPPRAPTASADAPAAETAPRGAKGRRRAPRAAPPEDGGADGGPGAGGGKDGGARRGGRR